MLLDDHVENLPDDAFMVIFNYLSVFDRIRLERVSRRFQRISRCSWKNVKRLRLSKLFEMDEEFIDVKDCNKILCSMLQRAGGNLLTLDLSNSLCSSVNIDLNIRSFKAIGRHCLNLRELNLSFCSVSNQLLSALANCAGQLESLKLVRSLEDEEFPDVGLVEVFRSLNQLKFVDFSVNESLTGISFVFAPISLRFIGLNNCPKVTHGNLHELTLASPDLSEVQIGGLEDFPLDFLLRNLSQLEKLSLQSYKNSDLNYMAAVLRAIESPLVNLKEFDIGHSDQLNDDLMTLIATRAPNLEKLWISGKFSRVTDSGLRWLAECHNLIELDISWNAACGELEPIGLNGRLQSILAHNCDLVSKESLIRLISLCPTLTRLDATGCNELQLNFDNFVDEIAAITAERDCKLLMTVDIGDDSWLKCRCHSAFEIKLIH